MYIITDVKRIPWIPLQLPNRMQIVLQGLKLVPIHGRPSLHIAQASIAENTPRLESPRISSITSHSLQDSLGHFHLVLEGGNLRLCQEFIRVASTAYYAPETRDPIAGLMRAMRMGSSAAANVAARDEEHLDIGATGLVTHEGNLYVAQQHPTQVYIYRDGPLHALPSLDSENKSHNGGLPFDQDIELSRVSLEEGDVIASTSSIVARTIREREIRGILSRYGPEASASQLASLAAQRGAGDCDVLVIQWQEDILPPSEKSHGKKPIDHLKQLPEFEYLEPSDNPEEGTTSSRRSSKKRKSFIVALRDLFVGILIMILLMPLNAYSFISRSIRRDRPSISDKDNDVTHLEKSDYEQRREAISGGPLDLDDLNRQILDSSNSESGHLTPRSWPGLPPVKRGRLSGLWPSSGISGEPLSSKSQNRTIGPGSAILFASLIILAVVLAVLFVRNDQTISIARDQFGEDISSSTETEPSQDANMPAAGKSKTPTSSEYLLRAQDFYKTALEEKDDAQALQALQDAADAANQAGRGAQAAVIKQVNQLLAEIDKERDRRNKVVRLATSATIGDFPGSGVGVVSGKAQLETFNDRQYVIDAVVGQVLEFTNPKIGSTVLRKGTEIGQAAAGDPIAIVAREQGLLVIDSQRNVFSIVADKSPEQLRIVGTETWVGPAAYDNFQNNLYVLDPFANKIHKYTPSTNGYAVAPSNYFDEKVDIAIAVDLAIDGDVYVLLNDSEIKRYRAGKEIGFRVNGLDRPFQNISQIFTNSDLTSLYLVDQGNQRIVEIDKRSNKMGDFVRQFKFRGSGEEFFEDIRDIWVSESEGRLLVLGKNSLRQFVLPKLND